MRYVKWSLLALVGGWLLFELILNLDPLSQKILIDVSLPWHLFGVLEMPVWVALLLAFILAFLLALVLEVAAWYEYTRTIRLQRRQIIELQRNIETREEVTQTRVQD